MGMTRTMDEEWRGLVGWIEGRIRYDGEVPTGTGPTRNPPSYASQKEAQYFGLAPAIRSMLGRNPTVKGP